MSLLPENRDNPSKKRRQDTSLPHEIITDILSRLHPKSLIRFESVSKQFSDLIKSPHLVSAHLRRSSRRPSLLIQRRRRHHAADSGLSLLRDESPLSLGDDLRLPFTCAPFREPRVGGSSDGLLCLDIYSDNVWQPHRYVIWNPATTRFLTVPSPTIENALWAPPVGCCTVGLGFGVCASGAPKLVRIACFESLDGAEEEVAVTRAEVFAPGRGNDSWREIKVGIDPFSIGETEKSVRVDGALHWIGCGAGRLQSREFIVSFDIAGEAFTQMGLPGGERWSHETCREIVEYKGKVGVFVYPRIGFSESKMEMWVLRGRDREEWTKVCRIGPFERIARPVGMWREGEMVMRSMERFNGGLFLCEAESKEEREVPGYGPDYSYQVYTHVDSLLCWD